MALVGGALLDGLTLPAPIAPVLVIWLLELFAALFVMVLPLIDGFMPLAAEFAVGIELDTAPVLGEATVAVVGVPTGLFSTWASASPDVANPKHKLLTTNKRDIVFLLRNDA